MSSISHKAVWMCAAGLLEQAASWLHCLILSLNPNDRLALFQTCTQLASQVVCSTPSVTLQLHDAPAEAINSRRNSLAKLMPTGRRLQLTVLTSSGLVSFPAALSSQVIRLSLHYYTGGKLESHWLQWSAFDQLHSLQLGKLTIETELMRLCDALEAGQLQQLGNLSCAGPFFSSSHCCERFARSLGSRIKTLQVDGLPLLPHIPHLPALHRVILHAPNISSSACAIMCRHPTLQVVEVAQLGWQLYGCHCEQPCNWRSLHLAGLRYPTAILSLPLGDLQELYIHHYILLGTRYNDPTAALSDMQALSTVMERFLSRVHLVPEFSTIYNRHYFLLSNIATEHLPIVSRLNAVPCWLFVDWTITWAAQGPAFLPALWAVVPPSCYGVRLSRRKGVEWCTFWSGAPRHVRHIEVSSVDFYNMPNFGGHVIRSLVACTPLHVESLRLQYIDPREFDGWEAAGVRQAAPGHLKLHVSCFSM